MICHKIVVYITKITVSSLSPVFKRGRHILIPHKTIKITYKVLLKSKVYPIQSKIYCSVPVLSGHPVYGTGCRTNSILNIEVNLLKTWRWRKRTRSRLYVCQLPTDFNLRKVMLYERGLLFTEWLVLHNWMTSVVRFDVWSVYLGVIIEEFSFWNFLFSYSLTHRRIISIVHFVRRHLVQSKNVVRSE